MNKFIFAAVLLLAACGQKTEPAPPQPTAEEIKRKRTVDSLQKLIDEEKNNYRLMQEAHENYKKQNGIK